MFCFPTEGQSTLKVFILIHLTEKAFLEPTFVILQKYISHYCSLLTTFLSFKIIILLNEVQRLGLPNPPKFLSSKRYQLKPQDRILNFPPSITG